MSSRLEGDVRPFGALRDAAGLDDAHEETEIGRVETHQSSPACRAFAFREGPPQELRMVTPACPWHFAVGVAGRMRQDPRMDPVPALGEHTDAILSGLGYRPDRIDELRAATAGSGGNLTMTTPITYLFVPGNRPERFAKALGSGADAVILDLEDAVEPAGKEAARVAVGDWLAADPPGKDRVLIRINDDATPWFADDLDLLRRAGAAGVVLPKAERAEQVARAAAALRPGGIVVPLIETARGLRAVDGIAAADGVQRLAFGTLDFAVDLNLSGDERGLIAPAMAIALASRCADKAPPVAGVTPAVDDAEALARDLAFARAVGFTAKLCIHPRQVAAVRRALAPTADEIEWAKRVLAAARGGAGAVLVDGRMVDRPVLLKAQSILDRADAGP